MDSEFYFHTCIFNLFRVCFCVWHDLAENVIRLLPWGSPVVLVPFIKWSTISVVQILLAGTSWQPLMQLSGKACGPKDLRSNPSPFTCCLNLGKLSTSEGLLSSFGAMGTVVVCRLPGDYRYKMR